jgi:uncharacterized protein (TIGR01655 family)
MLMLGLLLLLLLFTSIDINRFGKDNVYVEVIDHTDIEETKLDSGEIMTRYVYQQEAFDEEGKSIEVEFSANKKLRNGYLMLYINKENEVTSYDEVKWDEIPSKAQAELEDYYIDN